MRPIALILLVALSASCASRGAVPRPFPTPTPAPSPAPAPTEPVPPPPRTSRTIDSPLGYRIAAAGLEYRGVPYRNGGVDPTGFDCSGLVQYVLAKVGRTVPRETREQFATGIEVQKEELQAGDLVFFATVSPGASHVGIALDADEFVHAPNSRGVVRVESLGTAYWRTRFIGARRVR